ncbi:BglG family transcription antiterminator [Marininema halotolerans]|uniref:Activator of the mannose operon, transcriptional antiterminator n=1 Tax=Marininema halotolerans TaxID=1155944 RepID=A0A1I6U8S4_9BACL|nr:BglG family transcription antiterminator [Marininema halotolerans]SFS97866.1 activator of the mannose operon, transcriptional antiterminator [Marininema halotolerans]
MRPRRVQLIRHLIQAKEPLSVRFLAEEIGCSEKTVRNDLRVVKGYLEDQGYLTLTMRSGVGVYLEGSEQEKERVMHALKVIGSDDEKERDRGVRKLRLTRLLLEEDQPLTLADLAKELYISKGSVHSDLDQIEPWFLEHDLSIVRKPNVGIRVDGAEKARRLALSQLIKENRVCNEAFPGNDEISLIKDEINHLERSFSLSYTEEGITNLAIQLSVAMHRIRRLQRVNLSEEEMDHLKSQPEYRYAEFLAKRLEKRYAVHLPVQEIGYLTIHLLSAKVRQSVEQPDRSDGEERVDAEAWELAHCMIRRLSSLLDQPLDKDQSLLAGLGLHLHAALNRNRYGIHLDNPLLAEIKQNYRFLFELIISLLPEWEEKGIHFNAEEVGFLTLHFQAALERSSQMTKRRKVLLICTSGIGTSQLLQAKLMRLFPELEVVDIIASYELNRVWDRSSADFVISTYPVNGMEGRPVIQVSPFLFKEDQERIQQFLEGNTGPSSVRKYVSLNELLSEERLFLQLENMERDQVLRLLADALVQAGFVDHAYVESVLKREHLSSTAIGGGVAIPHGALHHIHHPGIAVATLKEPIQWEGEPIHTIFLLALLPEERDRSQRIFRELVDLSADAARLDKLQTLQNPYMWIQQLQQNTTS